MREGRRRAEKGGGRQGDCGLTPGHAEVVEALLNAGAKLKLKDADGTAFDNAQRQKQAACLDLLAKAFKARGTMEDAGEEEPAELS